MSKEIHQFTSDVLQKPPRQDVENSASDIHESNRFPDPYLYLEKYGKLLTPTGEFVEKVVEKDSYLGKIELKAIETTQDWAKDASEGTVIWFSPPFPGKYPVSKFIISEISYYKNIKILFNRNVVLDINANSLLNLANTLSDSFHTHNPEVLRATPIFPKENELERWLVSLSPQTNQVEMMRNNHDIQKKMETYASVNDILQSINVAGDNIYPTLYALAKEQGLIGKSIGSCGLSNMTSFEAILQNSITIKKDILECTCPVCGEKVNAPIRNGRVHCPECKSSAPYAC